MAGRHGFVTAGCVVHPLTCSCQPQDIWSARGVSHHGFRHYLICYEVVLSLDAVVEVLDAPP